MAPETINSTAVLVTAIGSAIAAIGVAVVGVLVQMQRRTIKQVERQGNSTSIELKRTNALYAKRLAVATNDDGDKKIADDARDVYNNAVKQAGIDAATL